VKGFEIAMKYNLDKICNPKYTYLFEIIYPENRIVVDYGDEESLILLAIFDGYIEESLDNSGWLESNIASKYPLNDLNKIKDYIQTNQEGFVVRFENGFRVKIKSEEYLKLHKVVTNVSSIDIWRTLKSENDFNYILDNVPDEFYDWVKNVKEDLEKKFQYIKFEAELKLNQVLSKNPKSEFEFFELVKNEKYSSIILAMRKGKNYKNLIWKKIKPEHKKAFQ